MAKIFFSYSHDDEHHRDQLEKHLSALRHEGLIESWHDRRLLPGSVIDQEIDAELLNADVVLLLVSSSFLASNYCYGVEMQQALHLRHEGRCEVLPVILRACEWRKTPLGALLAIPRDGKPITLWTDYDEAMHDVATQIRRLVESRHGAKPLAQPTTPRLSAHSPVRSPALPRSSNLRVRNEFNDADKDDFLHSTFEFLAQFFEGSRQELQERHAGIEGRFRRVDANTFTSAVFKNGKKVAECSIRVGGAWGGDSISYSADASTRGNSAQGILQIAHDDVELYWTDPLGNFGANKRMSKEQAAEHYWSALMRPLQ